MKKRFPDRRSVLAGLAGSALCAVPGARAQEEPARKTGLIRDAAARRGILFGSAFDVFVGDDHEYAALLRDECAILTTDYSLKFPSIRPDPQTVKYESSDYLIQFAQELKMPVRGHNLIWNDWMPDWVHRLPRNKIRSLFDRHIDELVGRYAGRVHSWDVVNEPIWRDHGNPGGLRDGPWLEAFGEGYIARAFRRARKADPKAKLILNESGMELPDWGPPVAADILRIVEKLLDANVPIDGVGIESHLQVGEYDPENYCRFLEKLQQLGLDIYITELDVDEGGVKGDIETRDRVVAEFYETYLRDVLQFHAVKAIITWQLSDRHTWYPGNVREPSDEIRPPRPLPFDTELKPKPAYDAILRALST